jgi:modulator of FtsH protease HflK
MNKDQQTYQRGVSASLLGLAIQLIVTALLIGLWGWSKSEVLMSAALHAAGGLGLWAALLIVFQQHKLERIESLEAEQIRRRHGGDTSIFETSADDLAVAQKRLRWLYRWLVPAVGLATSSYLIIVGALLIQQYRGKQAEVILPPNLFAAMGWAVGIAIVGFWASRFLAGMAKMPHWQLLRSGASYLMGVVVVALAVLLTEALAHFEHPVYFRLLIYIVPAFMILIGVEIVLNFVLDLYRPRKPGELPRPAFDSRLLSFLTSPESIAKSIGDAINYQFGFEITRSWFWQLLSRVFGRLVLLGIIVLLALSCIVIVEPNQQAVVTRFGKLDGEPRREGMHFKLPWPLGRAELYDVTAIRVITIGKAEADLPRKPKDPMDPTPTNEKVVLWTNRHQEDELDLIVAPEPGGYEEQEVEVAPAAAGEAGDARSESEVLARNAPPVSVLNAEVMVAYRIDPDRLVQYVNSNADADEVEEKHTESVRERARWDARLWEADQYKPAPNHHIKRLEHLAAQHIARFLLRHTIDEWIGAASVQAAPQIREAIQKDADDMGLGVEIVDVSIAGIHPPQTVADAFHEVVNAQQKKETAIETARQEAIRTLVDAAGSVAMAEAIIDWIKRVESLRTGGASQDELADAERRVDDLLRRAEGQTAVTIAQARADRWQRENSERGRARAYETELEAYRAAPNLYVARKYLQIAAEGYRDANKYIIAVDHAKLNVRGDFKEVQDVFRFDNPEKQ